MRNPNGYGTVARLSGNRRRPYIVKKVKGWNNGNPVYDIIGYASTREEGNLLLAEYNRNPWNVERSKITFKELFDLWIQKRSGKMGRSNLSGLKTAANYCADLYNLPYREIRSYQMQDTIDNCGHGYSTQGAIKNLWGHLDRFALELDIITRSYSALLTSAPIPPSSRDRFSDKEIEKLWESHHNRWTESVLFLIYSGWRISEFLNIKKEDVNLAEGIITGGIKTAAGKGRIVPIHSLVRPFVDLWITEPGEYLFNIHGHGCSSTTYRKWWKAEMEKLEIQKTPHECRHTFESLLDGAGANRKCIDLMMGHVSQGTGNRVYNHKTIEELKESIELVTR